MEKILVIGSANVDFVVDVEDMPALGETLLCKEFQKVPGGKGANQAYACGRLGGDTMFLSVVGRDELGDALIENLKRANVCTKAIRQAGQANTGMAIVYVDHAGDNSIVVVPGANSLCDVAYLEQNLRYIEDSSIVLLQMEIPFESVCYAVRRAKALGKTVILNPAPVPEYIPEDIYQGLDFITPNESEFKRLTGCPSEELEDIAAYGQKLLAQGVRHVIVTLGGRGAILITQEGWQCYPPPSVKVVDTTAAGDTFNAALARKLAEGCTPQEAIQFANYASALAVSKPGAQPSIPSYAEVVQFIQSTR